MEVAGAAAASMAVEVEGDSVACMAKRLVVCGAAGEEIQGRLGNVVGVEAQGRAGWVPGVSGHC